MADIDVNHIAYVFVHNGLDPLAQGGCSCGTCERLRKEIGNIRAKEAEEWYQERYGQEGL